MFRKGSSSKSNVFEPVESVEETSVEETTENFEEEDFEEELENFEEEEREEESKSEEERALEIFNDDELQNLWCYVNQVSLQGRLYFRNEIKIDDTTISNKVASFNLLIKKKTKNGVKRHRIYVKTYNKEIIEWLSEQKVGTWVKVEGRLEAASSKTYVNATSITAFSDERIKAIFAGFADASTQNVDWKDFDKNRAADPELNKEALRKLKEIKQQTRRIAMGSNCVYIDEEDKPVTAAASKESLSEEDLMDIAALTQELVTSYSTYISSLNELYDEEESPRKKMSLKESMRRNPIREDREEDPLERRQERTQMNSFEEEDPERDLEENEFAEYMYDEDELPEMEELSEFEEDDEFAAIPELEKQVPLRTDPAPKPKEDPPVPSQKTTEPYQEQSAPPLRNSSEQEPLPVGARLVKSELISSVKSRFRSGGRFDRRNRR